MAGITSPFSSYPDTTGNIYPGVHTGGTNSRLDFGMQVEASLSGDSVWHLRFAVPPSLPSGTCKLKLVALANATSGVARVNPKWASLAAAENPDTITLNAEGVQSITWSAGDADDYKETKITLDADTVVAGEYIIMSMTFETASWTLAAVSTWHAFVIWE